MSQSIFFIGDLHLGHEGIMKFGQRQFDTIEEHDVSIMERWNSVVKRQRDIVWVLGDVAFSKDALDLLRAFNGEKRLILGNHDNFSMDVYAKYFTTIGAFERRYHGMAMTHIPVHPSEMQYRTWKWNIHGHCHHADKAPPEDYYINVNADVRDLTPVPLEVVREECPKRGNYHV